MEQDIETSTYKGKETLSRVILAALAKLYAITFGSAPWFEVGRCPKCETFYSEKGIPCPKDGIFVEEAYPLEQTIEYIRRDLARPQSVIILSQDPESEELISFAWGYQTTIKEFLEQKYQQDQEVQHQFMTLFEIGFLLSPDSPILYISEMGTAPQWRGRGLATYAIKLLLEQAKDLSLPVITRTIVDSPSIYSIAIKLGMTQISGPVRNSDF